MNTEIQKILWAALEAKRKELLAAATPVGGWGAGSAYYSGAAAGMPGRHASAMATCHFGQGDGTDAVWNLTVNTTARQRGAWEGDSYVYHDEWDPEPNVRAEGPFTDSHDAFWAMVAEEDQTRKPLVINGTHYVVEPDITNERSLQAGCAGYGGRLFRYRLKSEACVCGHTFGAHWPPRSRNEYLGECDGDLRDEDCPMGLHEMERPVYETRNLWYQGVIPPKHRDNFPDNAEFVND